MDRRTFLKISLLTASFTTLTGMAKLVTEPKEDFTPLPDIDIGGLIRPPGAIEEKNFRSKCISCGVCVNVCHIMKYDAVAITGLNPPSPPFYKGGDSTKTPFYKGGLGGILNLGTPLIKDMRDYPCALCMECPRHCPTGALQKTSKEDVKMGVALIDFSLCFGYNGDVCLSCSKACPLGATVFDFYNGSWGNQPYINERCVGCGLCVKYCPLGGSAIKVITRSQYTKIKDKYISDFKKLLNMSDEQRYNIVYGNNLPQIMARGRIIEREYR